MLCVLSLFLIFPIRKTLEAILEWSILSFFSLSSQFSPINSSISPLNPPLPLCRPLTIPLFLHLCPAHSYSTCACVLFSLFVALAFYPRPWISYSKIEFKKSIWYQSPSANTHTHSYKSNETKPFVLTCLLTHSHEHTHTQIHASNFMHFNCNTKIYKCSNRFVFVVPCAVLENCHQILWTHNKCIILTGCTRNKSQLNAHKNNNKKACTISQTQLDIFCGWPLYCVCQWYAYATITINNKQQYYARLATAYWNVMLVL